MLFKGTEGDWNMKVDAICERGSEDAAFTKAGGNASCLSLASLKNAGRGSHV